MAISGVVGAMYKAKGPSTAFTTENLTNTGDNKRYAIANAAHRYWDHAQIVTIEKSTDSGNTWVTVTSGFEIEYAGGHVVFKADQGNTALFRASGKYFTPQPIGGGFKWSLDIEADTLECTTFQNNGWKSFIPSVRGFGGSFETYFSNGENFADLQNTNLILILYTDEGTSKARYEGYATFVKNSIETPNDNLVTDKIDFKGGGKIYYREG